MCGLLRLLTFEIGLEMRADGEAREHDCIFVANGSVNDWKAAYVVAINNGYGFTML